MPATPGLTRPCPGCGRKNRVAYGALDRRARCGACKAALPPPSEPIEVADAAELRAIVGASALPVLVDFWAGWCGPCVMVAPEVKKVARRHAGRLLVVKADTEGDPALSRDHRIQALPTLAVFRGGREAGRVSGALPAEGIEELIAKAV